MPAATIIIAMIARKTHSANGDVISLNSHSGLLDLARGI